jgi:hypothetical protein
MRSNHSARPTESNGNHCASTFAGAAGGDVDLCKIDKTASITSWTLTAFMQRKSIGHSRKKHGLHST